MIAHSADSLRILCVASLPRSGSAVLGYVLGRLPGTIFVGELVYFWRRFAEGELCSCGQTLPDCRFWSAVVVKAFGSLTRRIQGVCARSSASFSDGFMNSRVLRGRLLSLNPPRNLR